MITHLVVKTLIFNHQGKLLVLTRSADDEHRAEGLDLPGGQVDAGETVTEGALREVREEVGLMIPAGTMQLAYAYTRTSYRESRGESVSIVWLGYFTRLPQGQRISLSHEHSRYQWLTLNQFAKATDHRGHHDLIAYIRENRICSELWAKG